MRPALVPVVLLLLGTGGGVAAGLYLAPPAPEGSAPTPGEDAPEDGHGAATAEDGHLTPSEVEDASHAPEPDALEAANGHDYVRLDNQFVVPLLADGHVVSLVLLSLAVETRTDTKEEVRRVEPKLRDLFLRVLFDHANAGRFDGLFTAAAAMRELRAALRDAAQEELGSVVTDVLILDIARQEQ